MNYAVASRHAEKGSMPKAVFFGEPVVPRPKYSSCNVSCDVLECMLCGFGYWLACEASNEQHARCGRYNFGGRCRRVIPFPTPRYLPRVPKEGNYSGGSEPPSHYMTG